MGLSLESLTEVELLYIVKRYGKLQKTSNT